jgi:hypothetical protein
MRDSLAMARTLLLPPVKTIAPVLPDDKRCSTPRHHWSPVSANAEYRVYAAILGDVTKRLRASQLLVRDSAGAFNVPGDGKLRLSADSLSAPVPIVLLGDSIEGSYDWRPLYRNRRDASGVLRLYRPVFNADTSAATAWLQNRCGPALCGSIEEIQLERRIDGTWTIVASRHVLSY